MEIRLPPALADIEQELKIFFDAMLYKLEANAHKGKWEDADIPTLFSLLQGEIDEMDDAFFKGNYIEAVLEAADVSNFAMMIASLALTGGKRVFGKVPPGRLMEWMQWALTYESEDCLPWPFRSRTGPNLEYGSLPRGQSEYGRRAHRVMCAMAHGAPPTTDHHAAHSCGHSLCMNKRHLRWATPVENQNDKKEHGTNVTPVKLNWDKVRDIRAADAFSALELAEKYGVSQNTIKKIRAFETWKEPK